VFLPSNIIPCVFEAHHGSVLYLSYWCARARGTTVSKHSASRGVGPLSGEFLIMLIKIETMAIKKNPASGPKTKHQNSAKKHHF